MTRQHLLYVYTGLRAEMERLAEKGAAIAAGESSAAGLQPRIIQDLSKLVWDPNPDLELDQPDIH